MKLCFVLESGTSSMAHLKKVAAVGAFVALGGAGYFQWRIQGKVESIGVATNRQEEAVASSYFD